MPPSRAVDEFPTRNSRVTMSMSALRTVMRTVPAPVSICTSKETPSGTLVSALVTNSTPSPASSAVSGVRKSSRNQPPTRVRIKMALRLSSLGSMVTTRRPTLLLHLPAAASLRAVARSFTTSSHSAWARRPSQVLLTPSYALLLPRSRMR